MPYVRYTGPQKAEAVALARVVGAEIAADQLGIDPRSVLEWMRKAGEGPWDDAPPGGWRDLMSLALARTTAAVASGKLSPTVVATIAGIAARNANRDAPKATDATAAIDAKAPYFDWVIDALVTDADLVDDETMEATDAAIDHLHPWLLRKANAEELGDEDAGGFRGPIPHREALLMWFSGRREDNSGNLIPAGDVLDWAKAATQALVDEHGSLRAWHAWQIAEDARRDAEWRAKAETARAEAAAKYANPPIPDDLAALVAEADAYLRGE